MSKGYLNHPRIAGFPTLAFHFCPVSTRIRLSWAHDLNFKFNDRAIVTNSPPAVEWHRAVLVMQITPCRGPWGHFTGNRGKLIRLTESACSGDTIYLSCIKSLDISGDSVAYIEDITCPRVDMNFIFEWSTRYLTSERSERVRYRVDHEKIKFISISGHVIFCLLYNHQ